MRATILVVDDHQVFADTIVLILNSFEHEFLSVAAYSAKTAIQLVQELRPDLVLLDVIMSDTKGIEHAISIRDDFGCNVLLMSGQSQATELLSEATGIGIAPFGIVAKPIHPIELINKIRQVLGSEKQKPDGSSTAPR